MSYLSPGVYVEEVSSAVKPIAGVSTSTAGFIGIVPDTIQLIAKGQPDNGSPTTTSVDFTLPTPAKTPKLITSWTQFTNAFGGLIVDKAPTDNSPPSTEHQYLAHAVYGFFNNGGSRCYVMRFESLEELKATGALAPFAAIDEIALVAAPGITDPVARQTLIDHCLNITDRFAILDGPGPDDFQNLESLTSASGVASPPISGPPKNTNYAAWYFPWIKVFDPATKLQQDVVAAYSSPPGPPGDGLLDVPPSGHLAGIYARVDSQRGVHKAPANEPILGALNVSYPLSKAEQDGLNPKGVNCIRMLNNNIFVWGARTIGGDANADLKYINVRRTLLFLRKSIEQGTQWVVFEPNEPGLWAKITRNITAFLTMVWRSGALFGTTPQQAFYVKCDAETNPPELRDQGRVVTEIGVAIVRPAEFVIFRISQWTPPTR